MLALRYVAESRADLGHRRRSTSLGATTVTAGLLVLVFGIVKAQTYGWGSARTIGLLAAGGRAAGAVRRDREPGQGAADASCRSSASGRWRSADAAMLLVASAMFGMFFFASLYVQEILGYSPLKAGLAFLPVTVGIMVGAGHRPAADQPLRARATWRSAASCWPPPGWSC